MYCVSQLSDRSLLESALEALGVIKLSLFFWPQSTTDPSGLISTEVVAENYRYQS